MSFQTEDKYSGIQISRTTSKGNENWFERSDTADAVREIRGKISVRIMRRKRLLVRVYREVRKTEGSRNRDFTAYHLKQMYHVDTALLCPLELLLSRV